MLKIKIDLSEDEDEQEKGNLEKNADKKIKASKKKLSNSKKSNNNIIPINEEENKTDNQNF